MNTFAVRCCWVSLVVALALAGSPGDVEGQGALELERAWFRPTLVMAADTVCDELLAYGETLVTEAREPILEWSYYETPLVLTGFEPISVLGLPQELGSRYIVTQGSKLYVLDQGFRGCGGACETRALYTSSTPFPAGDELQSFLGGVPSTPAVPQQRLLRRGDRYYAAIFYGRELLLLLLDASGDWSNVCRVELAPTISAGSADAAVQSALASIDALQSAFRRVMRGSGGCGSLNAHGRRVGYAHDALTELVYVPRQRMPAVSRADASDRLAAYLSAWALTGIEEHATYRDYQAQLEATTDALASFYEQRFAAAPAEARLWANYGLRAAIGLGFAFPEQYSPFPGAERLRTALLEKRPLVEIRASAAPLATEIPLDWIDGPDPNAVPYEYSERRGESLLNLAVEHPEALAYFLELGASPNKANDFGKTPLMYAAQRNSLIAAELLLDAGANSNATTVWPLDSCYYTLRTATMTPLHYAVRYASAELVNLLLDRGAATYIRTSVDGGIPGETPFDWFRRYTAPGAAERNPNIADGEIAQLAERLTVPSAENLAALAARLAFDAEARYAAGDVTTAYGLLRRALLADRHNTRALSDMSLIALRASEPGEAAGAAEALIALNIDARMTANAWFNLGLACSGLDAQYRVHFEQRQPCNSGSVPIYPFMQAWVSEPTAARAEKLHELFASAACTRNTDENPIESYIATQGVIELGYRHRVYAYHSAAVELAADAIAWDTTYSGASDLVLVERHELGERAITVYETATPGMPRVADITCRQQR